MKLASAWWPTFSAVDLRHEVRIQSQSTEEDKFGQAKVSWSDFRICFAAIRTVTGREQFGEQQITAAVSHMIVVRWTPDEIKPGMQVIFGDAHTYKIQYADNMRQMNRFIMLLCLELNGSSL